MAPPAWIWHQVHSKQTYKVANVVFEDQFFSAMCSNLIKRRIFLLVIILFSSQYDQWSPQVKLRDQMQWKKKIRNVETTICNAVHPLELIGKAELQVAIIFSSHNDHVLLAPEWVSHQVYFEPKCKVRDMSMRDHFSVVWIIRRNLIRTTIPPPTTIKYKSAWSSSI